jgi:hypothetical protein
MIVAYNSAEFIETCIASIAPACREHRFEVLMIDNGDGSTAALVAQRFPEVRIAPSLGNVGFAAGNNALARLARADRLLLVNPDMTLMPGAIDALLGGAARHPDAAGWGGVSVDQHGAPIAGNNLKMPSLIDMASQAFWPFLASRRPSIGPQEDTPVAVLSGGFVMFNRAAWERVGGFDERYFLYSEEVDLFYRLERLGYAVWRISDARAHHAVGHGANFSPMRLLYRSAGEMEFVRHHWSAPAQGLAFLLIWISALERYCAGKLLGAWRPRLRGLAAGWSHVALRPHYWMRGYDPDKGLRAKLDQAGLNGRKPL